uniref:F5/8 type C domain-containing protein n=1 Tax=Denticeps clupeoides TaxID=299321 RepID=A0AAY4BI30_9TELE
MCVVMPSKRGSRSSLRASFRALFETPEKLDKSTCLEKSKALGSPLNASNGKTEDADGGFDWTKPNAQKTEDVLQPEDALSLKCKDAGSVDGNREISLPGSCLPDPCGSMTTKDLIPEADTTSATGTIESKAENVYLAKTKEPCECSGPLGMEGGIISNQQITASSTHRSFFQLQKWYPYFARLNKKGLVNAWSAAESDRWPWIQINLQRRMRVTGLVTQGAKRVGIPEYVKSYKVAFSEDGENWIIFQDKDKEEDMLFRGNVDNNTPYGNSFTPPIEAQYIRIHPQVCRKHCTLRMELLGCELTGCSEPLGMKAGHIQDLQITSSSVFHTLNIDMFSWEPGKARLDEKGKVNAWASASNDQSQWLQVDLLLPTKVTGIITQGAKDFGRVQFVGSYKLSYSNDGEKWAIYQDEKQQKDKIFQGNFDNETHRKNVIDPPIYARFVRIVPWSWYGRISLRVELLGCTEEDQ